VSSAPRGLARGQPTRCPCAAYASGHPVAEHLDTGQTTPQASRWLACTEGCGAELELRLLHPPWPGARPPAPTRCLRAAYASIALSRSTSTLDRPHLKPRGGWLAQGAVAMSSSCGCCTPCGLARGQPTRCARAAYASGRPVAEHLDTGQTTPQASRWLACTGGCVAELELREAAPPVAWRAAPAPTRCLCAASASVALSRSTSTLDRPHLKPQGGWLATGAVALSSSGGQTSAGRSLALAGLELAPTLTPHTA